jgi:hypothetical protein
MEGKRHSGVPDNAETIALAASSSTDIGRTVAELSSGADVSSEVLVEFNIVK